MTKVVENTNQAIRDIPDGATVMIGGFGGSGAPIELIHSLIDRFIETGSPKNLTVVNNNAGNGQVGLAAMIREGMVSKLICSFPRSVDPVIFNEAYEAGSIELELVPQGTLAERIRAAGAGIPAFYTPTGVGTPVALGKEHRIFNGQEYIMETALSADYALIRAEKADTRGNLQYIGTSRAFNPAMATAAQITIAEVDQIVEPGGIDPERVGTLSTYVDRIVKRIPGDPLP